MNVKEKRKEKKKKKIVHHRENNVYHPPQFDGIISRIRCVGPSSRYANNCDPYVCYGSHKFNRRIVVFEIWQGFDYTQVSKGWVATSRIRKRSRIIVYPCNRNDLNQGINIIDNGSFFFWSFLQRRIVEIFLSLCWEIKEVGWTDCQKGVKDKRLKPLEGFIRETKSVLEALFERTSVTRYEYLTI